MNARFSLAAALLLFTSVAAIGQDTYLVTGNGDFQEALDRASGGDRIVLAPGTYTGPFRLRNKAGTGWIRIESSGPCHPQARE